MDCFRNSMDHAEEYLCDSGINKHNAHVVALIAGSTRILVVQKMFQVGGLVFNTHRNRFTKELSRRDYVTGEMRRNKPPFRLALNRAGSDCVA